MNILYISYNLETNVTTTNVLNLLILVVHVINKLNHTVLEIHIISTKMLSIINCARQCPNICKCILLDDI